MFIKKLNTIFLIVIILGTLFLLFQWYKDYNFKNSPLSREILAQIKDKELQLQRLVRQYYKKNIVFPIIISNKMNSKLFGMAVYDKNKKIAIYLNKKRFQESVSYMINDVLPHEYAHAMSFALGDFSQENAGHSRRWERICNQLEGLKCNRFVNHNDIVIGKTKFLYQ